MLALRATKGGSIAACHPPALPEWPRSGCIEGAARGSVSGLPPSIRSPSYSGRVYLCSSRGEGTCALHAIPQPSLSGRAAAVSKGPREAPSLAFPLRYALRATQGGFILALRATKGRFIAACHPPALPEWPRSGCIEGAARGSVSGLPPSIRSPSYSGRVYLCASSDEGRVYFGD